MATTSEMTVVGHLSELRRRLIYSLITFAVLMILCLVFVSRFYGYLVSPLRMDGYKLMVISPGEVITVYLSVAGSSALVLTLPVALYHVWRFVAPGLLPRERRYALRLIPVALVMFLAGISFAWFVTFPLILRFLLQLSSGEFTVMIRATTYFAFLRAICLPFGLVFELPIVVIFLTRLGIITPQWMRKMRRIAYVCIVILGALISPPELISHLSVVLPMMALYEISCVLSSITEMRIARSRTVDLGDPQSNSE